MGRQDRRTTKSHATLLSALAAFTRPGADQLALEFSQAGKNSHHQAAVRARRVCPGVMQRLKACATLGDVIEDIEQVPSVEALEHLGELRSIAASAADLLGVDLGAASGVELSILGCQGLPVGA